MKTNRPLLAQLTVAACASLAAMPIAHAKTRTFEFSFDWDEGSLAGQVTSGRFSFDASLFHPTNFVQADQLFSQFSIEIDGRTFDETQAPGHYLRFHPDGRLRMVAVGTNCNAVTCWLENPQDFTMAWSGGDFGQAQYAHAPNEASYADVIHLTEVSAVPEPGAWAMLLLSGPLVVAWWRRRPAG
ncbi:PEP-CTERM sorting domain-containing protein [Pseudaquabacterium pictum]|uniref:PEP-CTERM protein-sorting domain-containing protein n=1 Tax=Pseudaquabacterium pictum TaxID=2315236 RepID=A0A480AW06_9BURK|nr:PEP-CTERM sorting domain-containing protein [Rubrivivax pictus]GCL65100.1 hypothetical protein AQPW35_41810 [Rubrivivax pictus]